MDISVVVPLFNEDESLTELEAWIRKVMQENNFSYEIMMVDDGSTDNSWKVVQGLSEINPNVKGIKFRRNYGKSAALHTGFQAVQGDVVITMDADDTHTPGLILRMTRMIREGFDVVIASRYQPNSRVVGLSPLRKLYSYVASWIFRILLPIRGV